MGDKMTKLREGFPTCDRYYNQKDLDLKLEEIEKRRKIFESEFKVYEKKIKKVYAELVSGFKNKIDEFNEKNERFGNEEASKTIVTERTELWRKQKVLQEKKGGKFKESAIRTTCS